MSLKTNANDIERWGIFELSLDGPSDGNPFLDVTLSAQFSYQNRVLEPDGFYDGDGVYRIRFMPDRPGEWHYVTKSNVPELDGQQGQFTCVEASGQALYGVAGSAQEIVKPDAKKIIKVRSLRSGSVTCFWGT